MKDAPNQTLGVRLERRSPGRLPASGGSRQGVPFLAAYFAAGIENIVDIVPPARIVLIQPSSLIRCA